MHIEQGDNLPQPPLNALEIQLLRGQIARAKGELDDAEASVTLKRDDLEKLRQQWSDAGLLGS